ncbi:MAG: transketolase family protein [Gaiellaceae bacterium]
MPDLFLIPRNELARAWEAPGPVEERLALLADSCRLNALVAVKRAGSGHLGSSFSAADIVVHLLWKELNTVALGWEHPDRDIFFSSKGHDVPGLYAALYAHGVLPRERFLGLRRLGGSDGHPDVGVPGIEANSGSLGMGLSKGRGMAWAKRHLGRGGRVVVMTGDGELQEGQNYEALQAAAHQRMGNLVAIVDRNELQSDKPTSEILDLGDLEAKLSSFGWHVASCDGHDHAALAAIFDEFRSDQERPKLLIAHTIKGRGVSFMEHPLALREGGGTYRWHAGAPGDEDFGRARDELLGRIGEGFASLGLPEPALEPVEPPERRRESLEGEPESGAGAAPKLKLSAEYVVDAYGEALLELAQEDDRIVVLDGDLASDCRVRGFELRYPERFIEVGIAEQDMVSMAGGLARQGLLPVVNSFASFLASRANEQIYNNASEQSKIVYACHYAGLIPAGPGKSHQSLRDISLLGALPNCAIVQPCNAQETRDLLRWALQDASESVALRLAIGPSPRRIEHPAGSELVPGRGRLLRPGADALLVAYGPVMLHEALVASELLADRGLKAGVLDMPWLNRFDREWLLETMAEARVAFVVEDHAPVGGLGDALLRELNAVEPREKAQGAAHGLSSLVVFGVEGWPACGTPAEALRFHRLDGASLAERVERALSRRTRSGHGVARS